MKAVNTVKISFISLSANESFARTAISGFTALLDPTVEQLADIKTAVSEAVTNCIIHAYPDKVGIIKMTAMIYADNTLCITISDNGCGIENIEQAMKPMFTTGNPDERSGLGFAVMESFMDTLKVRSKPGKGTRVTMTKRILKKQG